MCGLSDIILLPSPQFLCNRRKDVPVERLYNMYVWFTGYDITPQSLVPTPQFLYKPNKQLPKRHPAQRFLVAFLNR
jgi:hypothetical protein